MEAFIEPFLQALAKYLPKTERSKLPPPWTENMTLEEWQEVNPHYKTWLDSPITLTLVDTPKNNTNKRVTVLC